MVIGLAYNVCVYVCNTHIHIYIYIYIYIYFYRLNWDVMQLKKPRNIKNKPKLIKPN